MHDNVIMIGLGATAYIIPYNYWPMLLLQRSSTHHCIFIYTCNACIYM